MLTGLASDVDRVKETFDRCDRRFSLHSFSHAACDEILSG